jgi:hypothetical protein
MLAIDTMEAYYKVIRTEFCCVDIQLWSWYGKLISCTGSDEKFYWRCQRSRYRAMLDPEASFYILFAIFPMKRLGDWPGKAPKCLRREAEWPRRRECSWKAWHNWQISIKVSEPLDNCLLRDKSE